MFVFRLIYCFLKVALATLTVADVSLSLLSSLKQDERDLFAIKTSPEPSALVHQGEAGIRFFLIHRRLKAATPDCHRCAKQNGALCGLKIGQYACQRNTKLWRPSFSPWAFSGNALSHLERRGTSSAAQAGHWRCTLLASRPSRISRKQGMTIVGLPRAFGGGLKT
jgi:hypothetical protein